MLYAPQGRSASKKIHTLVLEAFVGPRPPGLVACHGNGDHFDNRLRNLRWGTYSDNAYDQVRHGTHKLATQGQCPYGHPLRKPNLVASARTCLACSRARAKVRHARLRGVTLDRQEVADRYYSEIVQAAL
jgi:hypothetical protein